jgi:hypothetical protein
VSTTNKLLKCGVCFETEKGDRVFATVCKIYQHRELAELQREQAAIASRLAGCNHVESATPNATPDTK